MGWAGGWERYILCRWLFPPLKISKEAGIGESIHTGHADGSWAGDRRGEKRGKERRAGA